MFYSSFCRTIYCLLALEGGRTRITQTQVPLLDVLYEDNQIAVVAKPANVPCHHFELQTGKRKKIIKHNHLAEGKENNDNDNNNDDDCTIPILQRAIATFTHQKSIHLVHRLDSPTSGCLILAFSSEAAKEASMALSDYGEKTYYALCRGNGESLKKRGVFRVDGDVKDSRGRIKTGALTEIECLYGTDGPPRRCCLVKCKPHTGYYHQIRQHLAREHHPIVGENRHHPDRKENKFWRKELGLLPESRVCLHCYRIVLENPILTIDEEQVEEEGGDNDDNNDKVESTTVTRTRRRFKYIPSNGLNVRCPLPDDMKSLIQLTSFGEETMKLLN
mmetsp:Transcript_20730/g.30532  ORF Transcript_20730/g.30532 Transcript_20730/m.30532 type:complete len:332 (+) Transcript_20730:135-1130(+)